MCGLVVREEVGVVSCAEIDDRRGSKNFSSFKGQTADVTTPTTSAIKER